MQQTHRAKTLILWLFFLSGVAGLVYEVVWARLLERVMGTSVYSITTVLTVYMAGLALGSFIAGKLIDRRDDPLRIFGVLEAGIGIYCLLVPSIILAVTPIYRAAYQSFLPSLGDTDLLSGLSFARFGISALALIIPTTLMGATLPVLSKYFTPRYDQLGQSVGELYAVNTAGAVVGAFASGFFLMPTLGITGTIVVGAVISLAVACTVIVFYYVSRRAAGGRPSRAVARGRSAGTAKTRKRSRAGEAAQQSAEGRGRFLSRPVLVFALTAFALSGFAAMVYQVAWMRTLSLVIGSSVYAVSLTLTAFILGLAIGAAILARLVDRNKDLVGTMGFLEIGIGISCLAVVPIMGKLPVSVVGIIENYSGSFAALMAVEFSVVFAVLLVPTILMGAIFPVVCKLFTKRLEEIGRSVGDVYASNTVGAIFGSFVAGFILIPLIGIQKSIGVAVAVNLTLGIALVFLSPTCGKAKRLVASVAAVLAAVLFLPLLPYTPRWDPVIMSSGAYLYADMYSASAESQGTSREDAIRLYGTIEYHREGVASTVTVRRARNHLYLQSNGKTEASTGPDMKTQKLLAHVPMMMLHRAPEDVLVIGLASGVTVGSAEKYPLSTIDCVEIAPAMVEACRYFREANGDCLEDPRLNIIIEDGRNHVAFTEKSYDVIISQPSNPWISGVAGLFTREFFELARDRTRPGGVVGLWFQAYNMSSDDFRMVVRTFDEVFPESSIWELDPGVDYMLIGSQGPSSLDYALLESRLADEAIGRDLASIGVETAVDFAGLFAVGGDRVREYAGDAPIHTDDDLRLEFSAPKSMYLESRTEQLDALRPYRTDPGMILTGLPEGEEDIARAITARAAARAHMAMGIVLEERGQTEEALSEYEAALEASPREPEALEARSRLLCQIGSGLAQRHELDGALSQFRAAIEGGGDFPQPHCLLGATYLRLDRLDEAQRELELAVALDPEYAEAYFNLALVFESRGLLRERLQALEKFAEYAPSASNVGQVRSEIARLRQELGAGPD